MCIIVTYMATKKHILVTGGAGFIGSHMVDRLLQEGYRVSVLDNLSTGVKENIPQDVTFIRGDTSDNKAVEDAFKLKPDIVFHIAGCASTINSFTDPFTDIQANFIGTVNVVKACADNGISRLLFASSMTVYGFVEHLPVTEEDSTKPISYYGITKYAAERFAHATGMRKDLQKELNVTSFRMFNVYGPRQSLTNPYQGVMAIFIGNVLRGEPITIFGDGLQSRDFVYIDDVVDAWVTSIHNTKTFGEVFNVGFGQDRSINDLTAVIMKTLSKDTATYPMIKKEERPGDQRHMRADIAKLYKAIGWKPKYNLDQGLKETIAWAQKEQK